MAPFLFSNPTKIVSAQEEKSLSELMREMLRGKVEQQTGYQKAKQRHLSLLKKGLNLGTKGRSSYTRDELHARGYERVDVCP